MKKYLIAAVLATFLNSGAARAELSDSNYAFGETINMMIMDKVPCKDTPAEMNAAMKKFSSKNRSFKTAFAGLAKVLGIGKPDQADLLDYVDELNQTYAEDCFAEDPGEEF